MADKEPRWNWKLGLEQYTIAEDLCFFGDRWKRVGLFYNLSFDLLKARASGKSELDLCVDLIGSLIERGVTLEDFLARLEDKEIGLKSVANRLRKRFGLQQTGADPSSLPSKTFYFEVNTSMPLLMTDNSTIQDIGTKLRQNSFVIISNEISSGGTTLANEFCCKTKEFNYVLWLDATDDTKLLAGFTRLADWFKIPVASLSLDDLYGFLLSIFDRIDDLPTLLVFDNASTLGALRKFIPTRTNRCHAIFTTKTVPSLEDMGNDFGKPLEVIHPKADLSMFDEKCQLFVRMVAMLDIPEFPAALFFNTDLFVPSTSASKEEDLQGLLSPLEERHLISYVKTKEGTMIKVNEEYQQLSKSTISTEALGKWIDVLESTNSCFNGWHLNQAKAKIFWSISCYAGKSTQDAPRYLDALVEFLGFWSARYSFRDASNNVDTPEFNSVDSSAVALIKALCVIELDPIRESSIPKQSNVKYQLLEQYVHARQTLRKGGFIDALVGLGKCYKSAVDTLGSSHALTVKIAYWLIRTLLLTRQPAKARELLEEKIHNGRAVLDFLTSKYAGHLEDPSITKWFLCAGDVLLGCEELEEARDKYDQSLKHQLQFDIQFEHYWIRALTGLLCCEMEVRRGHSDRSTVLLTNCAIQWEDIAPQIQSVEVNDKYKDFSASATYYYLTAQQNKFPYRLPPGDSTIKKMFSKYQFVEITMDHQSIVLWKDGSDYVVFYRHALMGLKPKSLKLLQRLSLANFNSAVQRLLLDSIFNPKANADRYEAVSDLFSHYFLTNKQNPIINLNINNHFTLLRSTVNVEAAVRWWTKKMKAANSCRASENHYLYQSVIFRELSDIVRNIKTEDVAREYWTVLLEFIVLCTELPEIRDTNNFKPYAIEEQFPCHSSLIKGACFLAIRNFKEAHKSFAIQSKVNSEKKLDTPILLRFSQLLLARALVVSNQKLPRAKELLDKCKAADTDQLSDFECIRLHFLGQCLLKLGQWQEAKRALVQCYNEWTKDGAAMYNYSLLAETTFYLATCEKEIGSANASPLFTEALVLQLRHHVQVQLRYKTAEAILVSRHVQGESTDRIVLLHSENKDYINADNFEELYEERQDVVTFERVHDCQFVYYALITVISSAKFPPLVEVRHNNQTLVVYYEMESKFAIAIVNQ